MSKNIAVVSTKGGPGKSTVSTMPLPLIVNEEKINIYELDDNNKTELKSNRIKFECLKIKDAVGVVNGIDYGIQIGEEVVNIIDIGGGSDVEDVLNIIHKTGTRGFTFIIPINDDLEQIHNLEETIKKILMVDQNPVIYLILNKVISLDKDVIRKQFVGIYGSKRYMIDPLNKDILKHIKDIYFLRASPIFTILKNIYKKSLLDSYVDAVNIIDNLEKYKNEWAPKGREFYDKKLAQVALAKDVIELVDEIKRTMGTMEFRDAK